MPYSVIPKALETNTVCAIAMARSNADRVVSHTAFRPKSDRDAAWIRCRMRSISREARAGSLATMQALCRRHESLAAALIVPVADQLAAVFSHHLT